MSIARNYYTMNLRLPGSDAGLDSAMVLVWMEIELAYALSASTFSVLKPFTESFNFGFGLGFARGQGETRQRSPETSGSSGQTLTRDNSIPSASDKSLLEHGLATKTFNSTVIESQADMIELCAVQPGPRRNQVVPTAGLGNSTAVYT